MSEGRRTSTPAWQPQDEIDEPTGPVVDALSTAGMVAVKIHDALQRTQDPIAIRDLDEALQRIRRWQAYIRERGDYPRPRRRRIEQPRLI